MPKEAWFYMLSYELMKGTKGEIWGKNKKLMRKSPGVGSHFKKGMKRKENTRNHLCPLMWLFCGYECFLLGFSVTYAIFFFSHKYDL